MSKESIIMTQDELLAVIEAQTPPATRAWFQAKSAPFIGLALAHAKALPESRWLAYRTETSLADPDDHIPGLPGDAPFSSSDILAMTHERVINGGCVWLGYTEPEGGEREYRQDTVIGVLEGNPVRYSEQHGAYFWTEPDTREVVNISLHYPVDFRFEHGAYGIWENLSGELTFTPDSDDKENGL